MPESLQNEKVRERPEIKGICRKRLSACSAVVLNCDPLGYECIITDKIPVSEIENIVVRLNLGGGFLRKGAEFVLQLAP